MALAAVGSLQAPGTAAAADVSLDPMMPGGLIVTDVANETNLMTVRGEPGQLIVDDIGAVLSTTAPQCAPVAPEEVRCSSTGLIHLTAQLGGGNDSFRVDDSASSAGPIQVFIDGGEGDDSLAGGAGNDVLSGGAGNDAVMGGAGDDGLAGDEGNDRLDGEAGQDRLAAGQGYDVLLGGDGNDRLDGGNGADLLGGGAGDDVLLGGAARDYILGGPGSDTLDGGTDFDRVDGGPGQDSLNGGPADDLVIGGPDPDALAGGPGVDQLDARDGVGDVVDCGGGRDLTIGDSSDAIRDCDEVRVDRGLRKRPPLGRAARASPERGHVGLRVAGASPSSRCATPPRSQCDPRWIRPRGP